MGPQVQVCILKPNAGRMWRSGSCDTHECFAAFCMCDQSMCLYAITGAITQEVNN